MNPESPSGSPLGPVHTGRGAPCNMRTQITEHTEVNRSLHTGCSNIKGFAHKLRANLLTRPVWMGSEATGLQIPAVFPQVLTDSHLAWLDKNARQSPVSEEPVNSHLGKRYLQGHEIMKIEENWSKTPSMYEMWPEISSLKGNKNLTRFWTKDFLLN